jgi:branched-chain amino acid transport system substrate-binding protein
MAVALDAINRAAPRTDRAAIVDAFFATRNRQSAIGTYSIDANGDTTARRYGVYGISRGRLVYRRAVTAR